MIKVIRAEDYEEMGKIAGALLWDQITDRKNSVLGLATGSTPLGVYAYLVDQYKESGMDLSELRTVNLDEYRGMERENPQSYYYFMNKNLWEKLEIREDHRMIPNGMCEDAEEECKRYEERIKAFGGIDLQLLGIGGNGHIGFNEPGESFICDTHVVSLTEETREANARFFESMAEVPVEALTMGVRTIMGAKKIVLVASGKGKADAIARILEKKVTPRVPATVLLLHPDVTIVADKEALGSCRPGIY